MRQQHGAHVDTTEEEEEEGEECIVTDKITSRAGSPSASTQWKLTLLYTDTPAVIAAAAASTENTMMWRSGQRKTSNWSWGSPKSVLLKFIHASK